MLIPKKNRNLILAKLFEDCVLCAKKDIFANSHYEINSVPNLHVIKLMLSLTSLGYVKEKFNWNWYYWILTDSGISYIRKVLHLPEEVLPKLLHPEVISQSNTKEREFSKDRFRKSYREDSDRVRGDSDRERGSYRGRGRGRFMGANREENKE